MDGWKIKNKNAKMEYFFDFCGLTLGAFLGASVIFLK
jgi:hypothetical protein